MILTGIALSYNLWTVNILMLFLVYYTIPIQVCGYISVHILFFILQEDFNALFVVVVSSLI